MFAPARKRGRGRPAKESFANIDDLSLRVAIEVELLTIADQRRGAKARAIRTVAKAYGHPKDDYARAVAWVKKATQRRSIARTFARYEVGVTATANELSRRLAGLPDDVRTRLGEFPAAALLELLR